MRDARLERIGENDEFEIDTSLVRSGAARHFSEHRAWARGGRQAQVSMCSAFVRRREAGNDPSAVRARFGSRRWLRPSVTRRRRRFRSHGWESSCARQGGDERPDVGLLPARRAAGHDAIRFEPCPNSDFNGADFPYFASFQAFVDRAEWASRPTPHDGGAVCADRDENG